LSRQREIAHAHLITSQFSSSREAQVCLLRIRQTGNCARPSSKIVCESLPAGAIRSQLLKSPVQNPYLKQKFENRLLRPTIEIRRQIKRRVFWPVPEPGATVSPDHPGFAEGSSSRCRPCVGSTRADYP